MTENESLRVEKRQGNEQVKVQHGTADPAALVRPNSSASWRRNKGFKPLRRWQAYSRQLRKDPALVAYYTFESVGKDSWLLPNVAATGACAGWTNRGAVVDVRPSAGQGGPAFRGPDTGDKVVLPEQQRFNFTGPFSLAVWFQVAQFRPDCVSALIAKGGMTWRLERCGTTNCLTIDSTGDDFQHFKLRPHTEVTDHRWHLVVAVVEPRDGSHHKRLYLDGRLEEEIEVPIAVGAQRQAGVAGGEQSMSQPGVRGTDRRGDDFRPRAGGRGDCGDVRGRQPGQSGGKRGN